jgi:glutaconate CoA-transferase subunit A
MVDWDEGMFLLGLQAAAWRVPFLPTRAGLGSDLLSARDDLRTVISPYADGEELVAAPAIELDVAICHVNRADARGNTAILGVDPYMDDLFLAAARQRFVSAEAIVRTDELSGDVGQRRISRLLVDGVVEAPHGAHFTQCPPDYGRDEQFQRDYAAAAKSEDAWNTFKSRYVDASTHADYLAAVGLS